MPDSIPLQILFVSVPLESNGQKPELFPPITQVVDSDDIPAVGFVEVGNESTDDGRTKMTGVEGFGDVWGREIDCKRSLAGFSRVRDVLMGMSLTDTSFSPTRLVRSVPSLGSVLV
jgi:hypothetical protein